MYENDIVVSYELAIILTGMVLNSLLVCSMNADSRCMQANGH